MSYLHSWGTLNNLYFLGENGICQFNNNNTLLLVGGQGTYDTTSYIYKVFGKVFIISGENNPKVTVFDAVNDTYSASDILDKVSLVTVERIGSYQHGIVL